MPNPSPNFASTQWTLIWKAAAEDAGHGRPALGELIQRYWHPLYSFARQRGLGREDAEDATQEFLSGVVHGDLLGAVDPAKGKFRSFLLVAWKRFLIDDYRRRHTLRRGGDIKLFSVDFNMGERLWREAEPETEPDRLYTLCWARSLLDEVRRRLQSSYSSRDRDLLFTTLSPKLTETLAQSDYEELGGRLDLSPSAVKVALHRLRQRFGQTLRDVVLETLDDPSEIDAELAEMRSVLASHSAGLAEINASSEPESSPPAN
ncbi:MAG: sigma-70 family RNA polymerase sigma factor [Planctomycetota bacterium]